MDIMAMLNGRLRFIERFYGAASEPFETTKRKIEASEEPFVPRYAPGDYDGFEYEGEWGEADEGLRVLGQCSLGLVAKALQDYLREFVAREASVRREKLATVLKTYRKKDGWFNEYCRFLEDRTKFSWKSCPVAHDRVEQIILSRNDITHGSVIENAWPIQSEDHFPRCRLPRFADEMEKAVVTADGAVPEFPFTLNVTRDGLAGAIEDVRKFSAFVEEQRTQW
jgi:hypothetical protein